MNLIEKITQSQKIKKILKYEKSVLNSKNIYHYFGRIEPSGELIFIGEMQNCKQKKEYDFVFPITPKILVHCVSYMDKESSKSEQENFEDFKAKLNEVAQNSIYSSDCWQTAIGLCEEIVNLKESEHHLQ